jgi:transposase
MARIRKKHSPAFKAQVALEAAKQAKTIAELAKQFQVHPVQISQWKKQLLDGMETLFQNGSTARQPDPEKIQAELYEQLGRLQMELAWVKKKVPQQKLWVRSGSGSRPRLCNKASFATFDVRKPYDFLVTNFTLLFRPSTAPDETSPLARNQFRISGR